MDSLHNKPKQEPVAWITKTGNVWKTKADETDTPLYTTPPQRTEQEPVALETVYETIIQWDEGGGKRSRRELARRIVSLYTSPPKRAPCNCKPPQPKEPEQDLWAGATIDERWYITRQPEQEPVAWMYEVNNAHTCLDLFEPPDDAYDEGTLHPLYTTPPQRTWVGLTDEDVYPLANARLRYQPESYELSGIYGFARAIEAKLKEKNT